MPMKAAQPRKSRVPQRVLASAVMPLPLPESRHPERPTAYVVSVFRADQHPLPLNKRRPWREISEEEEHRLWNVKP
jgi:hypothetical protein